MDLDPVIRAAQMALPQWSHMEREPYLRRFAQKLKAEKETFAQVISQATGKLLWDARQEVQAMINKVDISIRAYRERTPLVTQGHRVVRHLPHGVLAVLGPFNFPGHLPNGHIIPALIAGNTVIFKPSEWAPAVGEAYRKLWDLPEGILQVVEGGVEVGQALASHPGIAGLLFTGSYRAGSALATQFAQTPWKILALEMGGNNPLVVGHISNSLAAVSVIIQSAFLSSGQRCTCARRLILQDEALLPLLIEEMGKIRVGYAADRPEPFMGPLIHARAVDQMIDAENRLIQQGARPLKRLEKRGERLLTPGLIDVTSVALPPDEEYFGPLLQVKRVSHFQDALQEANQTAYGLAASLLSDDRAQYDMFLHTVKAGILNWNSPTTGASSESPFGGLGKSGNSRPSAFYAADYCAYPVASFEYPTLTLPEKLPYV